MNRSRRRRDQARSDFISPATMHAIASRDSDILDIERMGNGHYQDSDSHEVLYSPETLCSRVFGKDCGPLLQSYLCTWDTNRQLYGRLFIMEKFLCFYNRSNAIENTIRISYSKVEYCKKSNTAFFIPDSIIICEVPGIQYIFRGITGRDDCFDAIRRQLRKSRLVIFIESSPSIKTEASEHSFSLNAAGEPAPKTPTEPSTRSQENHAAEWPSLNSPPKPIQDANSNVNRSDSSFSFSKSRAKERSCPVDCYKIPTCSSLSEAKGLWCSKSIGLSWKDTPVLTKEVHKLALESELLKKGHMEKLLAVNFPRTSVREFFETFVCDSSPCSLPNFHLKRGDWNVEYGCWHSAEDKSENAVYRSIKFKTPVNIPLGNYPKEVDTVKHQKLRVYGSAGVLYESATHVVTSVPFSDSFFVEEQWVIMPRTATTGDASPSGCELSVSWRCVWIKQAFLLRPIVEKQARKDVVTFNRDMISTMEQFILSASDGASNVSSTSSNGESIRTASAKRVVSFGAVPKSKGKRSAAGDFSKPSASSSFIKTAFLLILCAVVATNSPLFLNRSLCRNVQTDDLAAPDRGPNPFGPLTPKYAPIFELMGQNNLLLQEVLRRQQRIIDQLSEGSVEAIGRTMGVLPELDAIESKVEESIAIDRTMVEKLHEDLSTLKKCGGKGWAEEQ